MSIWFKPFTLDDLQRLSAASMSEFLDVRFTEIGADFLRATMPVNERTRQPFGLLHGGASVTLAETLGSVASNCCVDDAKFYCVGQEISANHIRSARQGRVTATARSVHLGSRSHVWDIQIADEQDRLICVSRLTMAVLESRTAGGKAG